MVQKDSRTYTFGYYLSDYAHQNLIKQGIIVSKQKRDACVTPKAWCLVQNLPTGYALI